MKRLLLVLFLILPVGAQASSTFSWMNASGIFSCSWDESSFPGHTVYLAGIEFTFTAQDPAGNAISGYLGYDNFESACTPSLPQIEVSPTDFLGSRVGLDAQWSYLGNDFSVSFPIGGPNSCASYTNCSAAASVDPAGNLFVTLNFGETKFQLEGASQVTSVDYELVPNYYGGNFDGDFPEANGDFITTSPEPTTWALLVVGIVGLSARRKLRSWASVERDFQTESL